MTITDCYILSKISNVILIRTCVCSIERVSAQMMFLNLPMVIVKGGLSKLSKEGASMLMLACQSKGPLIETM